jgi:hypothetical protein
MPRTFMVIVMYLMLAVTLQSANLSRAQDWPQRVRGNMASPDVRLGSWVNPAFEWLAAAGYLIDSASVVSDMTGLQRSLRKEFAPELLPCAGTRNLEFRVEFLDQRITALSGTPLRDDCHFAETLVDDDGRPFAVGANTIEISYRPIRRAK